MSVSKKLLQAAAGAAGGAGLDVDEVFSCHLYEGNNTFGPHTITNGIDLSGEGGLVWLKSRDSASSHGLYDTERGATKYIQSNDSSAEVTLSLGLTSFNNNGFSVDYSHYADSHVSWTFRKAPKFFDVVTWSGNGVNGRTISHNLGSTPGMILVKRLDSVDGWITYHRGMDASSPEDYAMFLNLNNARATETYWNNTAPTSTEFTVSSNVKLNGSSGTYVAYLFAHNNNDGEFGPDADQDVIKCGSFTDSGSSSTPTDVNLGFEPQWLLVKASSTSSDWYLIDVMREMSVNDARHLRPNLSNAETNFSVGYFKPTPTGFQFRGDFFGSGQTAIYMAIRRGPLAEPESATDVFGVNYTYTYDAAGNTGGSSAQLVGYIGKPADLNIQGYRSGSSFNAAVYDRLRNNKYLITNTTSAEASVSGNFWDNMAGFREVASAQDTTMISWSWKRAPGYFDVVAYTGTGSAGLTVNHNLGVAPEMMWCKNRDGSGSSWVVYHKDLDGTNAATKYLYLNSTDAVASYTGHFNDTQPTSSVITLGTGSGAINYSGRKHIIYAFATVAGVSKVGSYTGNGSTQNIDCGFSSGARFVLIKKTSDTGHWVVFDTVRGIVAGNDARLKLNSTDAEVTSYDDIDAHSAGFTLNNVPLCNTDGASYIFYAIA